MTNTPNKAPPPTRHKVAILTFFGLLIPVYVIPGVLASLLPNRPLLVTIMAVGLIVILMVYVIMPALTRLFHGWLTDTDQPPACAKIDSTDAKQTRR